MPTDRILLVIFGYVLKFMVMPERIKGKRQLKAGKRRSPLTWALLFIALLPLVLLLANLLYLPFSFLKAQEDAILVLGGDLNREVYVSQLKKSRPEMPIVVSGGSPSPCVWLIFDMAAASKRHVWLEQCADSTFGNFYFSVPFLVDIKASKVRVVTSQGHLPRAAIMSYIMLGAHGIWPVFDVLDGNLVHPETLLKTILDLERSLLWAYTSQVYMARCTQMVALWQVDLKQWRKGEFKCHPLPPWFIEAHRDYVMPELFGQPVRKSRKKPSRASN